MFPLTLPIEVLHTSYRCHFNLYGFRLNRFVVKGIRHSFILQNHSNLITKQVCYELFNIIILVHCNDKSDLITQCVFYMSETLFILHTHILDLTKMADSTSQTNYCHGSMST